MLDKAPEESENAGLTVSNADHGTALSEPCEDDIIEPRANRTTTRETVDLPAEGRAAASGKPNLRRRRRETKAASGWARRSMPSCVVRSVQSTRMQNNRTVCYLLVMGYISTKRSQRKMAE